MIFFDNSYNVYVGGVGESLQRNCRVRLRYYWAGLKALQNIQAFFNNVVTNVNVCTKHEPNFILRKFISFMNKFEVVSLFRSSAKYFSNLFEFVYFIQTLFIKYFVQTSDVHYWILKANYLASRIKITISHIFGSLTFVLFLLSLLISECVEISSMRKRIYFAGFVASSLSL